MLQIYERNESGTGIRRNPVPVFIITKEKEGDRIIIVDLSAICKLKHRDTETQSSFYKNNSNLCLFGEINAGDGRGKCTINKDNG